MLHFIVQPWKTVKLKKKLWKHYAGSATICVQTTQNNPLCSNSPSLLCKSGSDEMENFSLQKLSKEWRERGPPFFFPHDMCNSKGESLWLDTCCHCSVHNSFVVYKYAHECISIPHFSHDQAKWNSFFQFQNYDNYYPCINVVIILICEPKI